MSDAVCRVTVRPQHKGAQISPLFFGVNTLFMYDDDAALKDGKIARLLRDLPCRLVRYPGGDVADNYLWNEHRLDDPKWWPNRAGAQTTDTDEFMAFCRQAGAEPIFVVNLETGFVHGDVDRAVKLAQEWVAYCRKKDYRVRYWEIGNETYLYHPGKHKRARATAAEYAKAFVRVARAMKAKDPDIKTGAVGPQNPQTSRNNELPGGAMADPPEPPWWPTVLREAGREVDFLVLHEYPGQASLDYAAFLKGALRGGHTIAQMKTFARRTLSRPVPIALTEWNLGPQVKLRGMAAAQALAELTARYLTAGVEMACFWPLRFPGKGGLRMLLDWETKEPMPAYQVLKLFAPTAGATIVEASASRREAGSFAARSSDGRTLWVFVVNKGLPGGPLTVHIQAPGFSAGRASCTALTAAALETQAVRCVSPSIERQGEAWLSTLPAHAVAAFRLEA